MFSYTVWRSGASSSSAMGAGGLRRRGRLAAAAGGGGAWVGPLALRRTMQAFSSTRTAPVPLRGRGAAGTDSWANAALTEWRGERRTSRKLYSRLLRKFETAFGGN